MEDIYLQAMQEIEDTGKLSRYMRQSLQAHLNLAQKKQLALSCIENIMSEWPDARYPKRKMEEILTYLNAQDEIYDENRMSKALQEIESKLHTQDDFMLGYIYQAFSDLLKEDDQIDRDPSCKDEDLEYEEWETAYCACMIYKYEDDDVNEAIRKQRETDYWRWYLKKIASIQDVVLPRKFHVQNKPSNLDFSHITTMEEFVKAISYEFDYISHEFKDDMIIIHVYNLKNGTYCPTCHAFSNHVKSDYTGMMKLGKIKNMLIRLYIKNNIYFCDNDDCKEETFLTMSKVEYKERTANYKLLVKALGKQGILELLQMK